MSLQASEILLVLAPDARMESTADHGMCVVGHHRRCPVPMSDPVRAAFSRLADGGATEAALCTQVSESAADSTLFSLVTTLRMLDDRGLLCRQVVFDDVPFATLVPRAPGFRFAEPDVEPPASWSLSRFAYLHAGDDGVAVAESPLGRATVRLDDPRAASVLAALGRPHTLDELEGRFPGLAGPPLCGLLVLLHTAGLVAGDDEASSWEFHDLLFHMRSRRGRHSAGYGGTYPGRIAPPPLIRPAPEHPAPISLSRPDPEVLRQDPALGEVMERRRSVRAHGSEPITASQLGEFLWRSARYQLVIPGDQTDFALRPTPAGGALQELEIYAVVTSCRGLDPGIYHYRPAEHALLRVADTSPASEKLLAQARTTADAAPVMQVYLQITARCDRVFWKYESMAYALILKNLGAMYATMYLAATAMGLAPCALGGGDSELFAAATGIDACVEPAVGEFALGVRAED